MSFRLRITLLILCAIWALVACSAPSPQTSDPGASAANQSNQPASDAPSVPVPAAEDRMPPTQGPTPVAGDPAPAPAARPVPQPAPGRKPPPEMSDPLPPEGVRGVARLDRSCRTSADCTVKNVGNCCGAFPSCVNVGSPTDPAAVQAECAQRGMASVCGFKEVSGCQCVQGQCQDVSGGPVAR